MERLGRCLSKGVSRVFMRGAMPFDALLSVAYSGHHSMLPLSYSLEELIILCRPAMSKPEVKRRAHRMVEAGGVEPTKSQ
jgi:hypothetical protein